MGYSHRQLQDLEATINRSPCDLVLFATPIQLTRVVDIARPTLRVRYEYEDAAAPTLEEVLRRRLSNGPARI